VRGWSRGGRVFAALTVIGALATSVAYGQVYFPRRFSFGGRLAKPESFDGSFQFCRAAYQPNVRGDGGPWTTDYPSADANVSIRLSELTKTRVGRDASGAPNHLIVRLTDPELFRCPFIMMLEVGSAYFSDADAASLREYLLKGGFLWVDDFWGTYAWNMWASQIAKVLPRAEYPIVDLPPDHPLFRSQFEMPGMPQIPSINFWLDTGGTSERGPDSAVVHARAILDHHGRIMVLMTHNTDISDSWEREAEDPEYFYKFSVPGYAVAMNVLIYAMTH
jgi:hypothetical protein